MGCAYAARTWSPCRHQSQSEYVGELQELVGEDPPGLGIRHAAEEKVGLRVERLLLLWDEFDELVGYGRHLAASIWK